MRLNLVSAHLPFSEVQYLALASAIVSITSVFRYGPSRSLPSFRPDGASGEALVVAIPLLCRCGHSGDLRLWNPPCASSLPTL
jgi:hypothetical protein